jgi:hypothetical protein
MEQAEIAALIRAIGSDAVVAEAVGKTRGLVWMWRTGKRNPDMANILLLKKLARRAVGGLHGYDL